MKLTKKTLCHSRKLLAGIHNGFLIETLGNDSWQHSDKKRPSLKMILHIFLISVILISFSGCYTVISFGSSEGSPYPPEPYPPPPPPRPHPEQYQPIIIYYPTPSGSDATTKQTHDTKLRDNTGERNVSERERNNSNKRISRDNDSENETTKKR